MTRARELLLEAQDAPADVRADLLDEVVRDNLWLATAVARRFQHRGEELDDLVQVASMGLVEAVHRFDPQQGDFLAFAVPTMTGVVKRHFRDRGWLVRPPRRTQQLEAAIRREWGELAQELGQEPTDRQLANWLRADESDVSEAKQAGRGYSSTSLEVLDAVGLPVACELSVVDVQRCEARMIISAILPHLDDRERTLLRMRFLHQRSQADIGRELGISQMQVSRQLSRLLARLRMIIEDDRPDDLVQGRESAAA